jgi:hypothetical protein
MRIELELALLEILVFKEMTSLHPRLKTMSNVRKCKMAMLKVRYQRGNAFKL